MRRSTSATRTWRAWRRWCTTARWPSRTRPSAPSAMFRSPPTRTGRACNEKRQVGGGWWRLAKVVKVSDEPEPAQIGASGLEIRVPAAGEVQHHDGNGPDEIQEPEAPGVTVGSGRVAHRVVGEEPRVHAPRPDLRDDEGERVNERDVQHIVEERHAPKYREPFCDTPARAVQ